jgi:hypothetical protein
LIGPGRALRDAAAGFYQQSWRFVVFNTVLSLVGGLVLYLTVFLSGFFALLFVLVGPFAAALMHCCVRLVRDDDLRFREWLVGLRLHWRRGLVLATIVLVVAWLGVIALRFYGSEQWLLAVLVGDALAVFAAVQLLAWPRAVAERDRSLRRVFGEALTDFLNRPVATFALCFALVLVNAAGIVAAVMPFLTLTIAYSFLAAAYFALPRRD